MQDAGRRHKLRTEPMGRSLNNILCDDDALNYRAPPLLIVLTILHETTLNASYDYAKC